MLHPVPHDIQADPIVEFRGVTCGYDGQPALSNVDLRIMPGDFVGILGPSGAGKTTLLRSIVGAVDVYRGKSWWKDSPSTERARGRATCPNWRPSTGTSR